MQRYPVHVQCFGDCVLKQHFIGAVGTNVALCPPPEKKMILLKPISSLCSANLRHSVTSQCFTQLFWLYPQVCSPARSMNQPHKTHLVAHQMWMSVGGTFHCTFTITVTWCWDAPLIIEARFLLKKIVEMNFSVWFTSPLMGVDISQTNNPRGLHFVWGLCYFHVDFRGKHPGQSIPPPPHPAPLLTFFPFLGSTEMQVKKTSLLL